jgi:hypothetical protein
MSVAFLNLSTRTVDQHLKAYRDNTVVVTFEAI